MKSSHLYLFILLLGALFSGKPLASYAQSPAKEAEKHDLFIQTRADKATFSWLIEKTRAVLANADINDKLSGESIIGAMPTFTLNDLMTDPEYIKFREIIASTFKVDLKNSVIRLRIPKLKYRVKTIHANPLGLKVVDPTLELDLVAQLKGVYVELSEGMEIDFMIPHPKTKVLESYLTATIDPAGLDISADLPSIDIGVLLSTVRDDGFRFKVVKSNLDSIPEYVQKNIHSLIIKSAKRQLPVSADDIRVNPVTVRLNQMTRSITFDPFKPILQRKMPQIMTTVLTQVGSALKNTLGPKLLETIFSSTVRSDFSVTNEKLYTRYSTNKFSQPDFNQLLLGVSGDLCTASTYKQHHEQCIAHETRPVPVRVISEEDRKKSFEEVKESIARGTSDVVLSVSEEYMNRLLKTTIDAQLWKTMLEKDNLQIGPKGAFVVFNENTQTPQLYIDIIYLGEQGLQSVVINENRPLRFPLRISTSMSFTPKDGVPHLVIKTEKILSDVYEVMNGIPEYDMPSHLIRFFRKKVARMILKMGSALEGQTAVDMEVNVFKNVGLEKTSYEVSKYGRLNLKFKF